MIICSANKLARKNTSVLEGSKGHTLLSWTVWNGFLKLNDNRN